MPPVFFVVGLRGNDASATLNSDTIDGPIHAHAFSCSFARIFTDGPFKPAGILSGDK